MSPGRDTWMCRVAALGTSAPGPEIQSKPRGTSHGSLCHGAAADANKEPDVQKLIQTLFFAVKKVKCSSPEAPRFSRGGCTWMRYSITSVLWWRPLASHSSLLVRVHIYHATYPLFLSNRISVGEESSVVSEMTQILCQGSCTPISGLPGQEPACGCTSVLKSDLILQSINSAVFADSGSLGNYFSQCRWSVQSRREC